MPLKQLATLKSLVTFSRSRTSSSVQLNASLWPCFFLPLPAEFFEDEDLEEFAAMLKQLVCFYFFSAGKPEILLARPFDHAQKKYTCHDMPSQRDTANSMRVSVDGRKRYENGSVDAD